MSYEDDWIFNNLEADIESKWLDFKPHVTSVNWLQILQLNFRETVLCQNIAKLQA